MESRVNYKQLSNTYTFERKETKGGNHVIPEEIADYIVSLEGKIAEDKVINELAVGILENTIASYKQENKKLKAALEEEKKRTAKMKDLFDPYDLLEL